MSREDLDKWLAKVSKTVDRKIVKAIYIYQRNKLVKVWDCKC